MISFIDQNKVEGTYKIFRTTITFFTLYDEQHIRILSIFFKLTSSVDGKGLRNYLVKVKAQQEGIKGFIEVHIGLESGSIFTISPYKFTSGILKNSPDSLVMTGT